MYPAVGLTEVAVVANDRVHKTKRFWQSSQIRERADQSKEILAELLDLGEAGESDLNRGDRLEVGGFVPQLW